MGVSSLLALLYVVPLVAVAQDSSAGLQGEMQIMNDGKKPVRITLWSNGGEPRSPRQWTLAPGQADFLGNAAGRRLRVRDSDKMRLGRREPVDVAQVGQFQEGRWYVSVRMMRRATQPLHGLPPDPEPGVPPDLPSAVPFHAPPAAPSARPRY